MLPCLLLLIYIIHNVYIIYNILHPFFDSGCNKPESFSINRINLSKTLLTFTFIFADIFNNGQFHCLAMSSATLSGISRCFKSHFCATKTLGTVSLPIKFNR